MAFTFPPGPPVAENSRETVFAGLSECGGSTPSITNEVEGVCQLHEDTHIWRREYNWVGIGYTRVQIFFPEQWGVPNPNGIERNVFAPPQVLPDDPDVRGVICTIPASSVVIPPAPPIPGVPPIIPPIPGVPVVPGSPAAIAAAIAAAAGAGPAAAAIAGAAGAGGGAAAAAAAAAAAVPGARLPAPPVEPCDDVECQILLVDKEALKKCTGFYNAMTLTGTDSKGIITPAVTKITQVGKFADTGPLKGFAIDVLFDNIGVGTVGGACCCSNNAFELQIKVNINRRECCRPYVVNIQTCTRLCSRFSLGEDPGTFIGDNGESGNTITQENAGGSVITTPPGGQ